MLEVEAYRQLAHRALDRPIVRVDAPDAWFLKGGIGPSDVIDALTGRQFGADRRIGKLLLLDVVDGPTLGVRFGMTGRLLVDGDAAIDRLEYSSDRNDPAWDRFGLTFADGGRFVVRDPRRLGAIELDPDESRLGPDAGSITTGQLAVVLGDSEAPLKARLLDQARIAGLGNLLVDEILWRAGLDPARPARSITPVERRRLRRRIVSTVAELGERGGSHTGDLQVMRSRDGVCPRDGAPLQRRTVGGRTTYSCPVHQPSQQR